MSSPTSFNLILPRTAPQDARGVIARLFGLWLRLVLGFTLLALPYGIRVYFTPEWVFLSRQDLPVVVAACLVFALAIRVRSWPLLIKDSWLSSPTVLAASAAVLVAGGLGVGLVFQHFTLSLDEFMANFDADIFGRGLMFAQIPEAWRPYSHALQPAYVLQIDSAGLWASSYLPINAMFRAVADKAHLRDWINPLFSAVGVLATYAVGRQIWPANPRRAAAAALLMASSAQLLVTGMSAYAMPAHLALNMIWLWLFLRDRPLSDLCALIIGFAAVGLHQLIFHPLFVGFLILELWLGRRYARAAVFTAAYAAICLFWVGYWALLYKGVGVAPEVAASVGGDGLIHRTMVELAKVKIDNLGRMAENVMRFLSWQNIVTPPLMVAGALAVRRTPGPLRATVYSILATGLAMLILVPSQTHGWGYRYLHGVLGAACLLAVHGWVTLTVNLTPEERAKAERALGAIALASTLVVTPLHIWHAYSFNLPYARSAQAINASGADIVLVDDNVVGFDSGTLVHNDPFLTKGPKILLLSRLSHAELDDLCARGKVWVFDASNPAAAGMVTFEDPNPEMVAQRQYLRQKGCAA